jgi:hypothetical protein
LPLDGSIKPYLPGDPQAVGAGSITLRASLRHPQNQSASSITQAADRFSLAINPRLHDAAAGAIVTWIAAKP